MIRLSGVVLPDLYLWRAKLHEPNLCRGSVLGGAADVL